jgi:type I restriction enzyme S subunit
MTSGWTTKTLGEVCGFVRGPFGGSLKKSVFVDDGFAVYEQQHAIYDQFEEIRYFIDKVKFKEMQRFEIHPNDLIMSCSGTMGKVAIVPDSIRPGIINQALLKLTPSKSVLPEFLKYWMDSADFQDSLKEQSGGAAIQNVASVSILKEIKIPFPLLPEQQRIVGILDEAFEGIATAKANAEKNLKNVIELFESYLQNIFNTLGNSCKKKKISEFGTAIYGYTERASFEKIGPKFLRITDIQDDNVNWETVPYCKIDKSVFEKYKLKDGDIVFARTGATTGKSLLIRNPPQSVFASYLIKVQIVNKEVLPDYLFLYFHTRTYWDAINAGVSGSAQGGFNATKLSELSIPIPSILEQERIIININFLSTEIKRLENIYQQKLAALEALKKSLLHQAFTGQLTAGESTQSVSVTIPFPQTLPNITTTDLHAGILAMAYQLHEKNKNLEYFTHVKAEKIAHMVEARLGIDLGRKPVKDAAGPNDFPHLHKVEHRAKMANFFDFKQVRGGPYRVQKLHGFDRLINKTRAALGLRLADVEGLLQWMLPMKVKQAEIAATVYAAWNNLLLEGKKPTDEEIVYEARENWHPNKLKIERERFFKAVDWLRKQNVIPEGKGKRVMKKSA